MSTIVLVILSIHIAISLATLIVTFKHIRRLDKATMKELDLSKYFFKYMNKLDFSLLVLVSYISLVLFAILPLLNILDLVLLVTQTDSYEANTIKNNEKTIKEICKKHNINYEASKKANNKSEMKMNT